MKTALTWRLSLHLGFTGIEAAALEQVEPGDILIYTSRCELVLPASERGATHERGWRVVQDEASTHRFSVEHFHEWSSAMPTEDTHDETNQELAAADLRALPVRVHVVLGYVDMDLKQLEDLTEGSIVELDAENRGTAQLVAGETVLGSGELVELEDHRLGVQITRWREQ
jgi:type III secretion system YscQ/HrcQ family protein